MTKKAPSTTVPLKIEKQPRLRQIVYEKLKDAILTGVIPRGTRLYESKIAEQTGISRTPVREALHTLEREFLIRAIDKVGYEVVDCNIEDLDEISEIRKTVEALALKKAVEHIGEGEIGALEENLRKSEKAVREHKPTLFVQLDAEFHNMLCSLSRSDRLMRMADSLRKEMVRFRSRTKEDLALAAESLRYHQEIVRLLKMRDLRGARKVLSDHIDHARKQTQKEFVEGA